MSVKGARVLLVAWREQKRRRNRADGGKARKQARGVDAGLESRGIQSKRGGGTIEHVDVWRRGSCESSSGTVCAGSVNGATRSS